MKLIGLTITILFCFTCTCSADLVWESKKIEVKAELLDDQVVGIFEYHNTGPQSIQFTKATTSCGGCLSLDYERGELLPDMRGEVKAVFPISGETGTHIRLVKITTSDGVTHELELWMTIPPMFDFKKRFFTWKKGEEGIPKVVTFRCTLQTPIKILSVKSDNNRFLPLIEELENGRVFRLTIIPMDTSKKAYSKIRIATDLATKQRNIAKQEYVNALIE